MAMIYALGDGVRIALDALCTVKRGRYDTHLDCS